MDKCSFVENINYLVSGYDIRTGNPFSDTGADPGFKAEIFDLDYSELFETGDRRFILPRMRLKT